MASTLVGFAGMTHLGIVSAVATAARGFSVLGYDEDHELIARLRRGAVPVVEPQLDTLAAEHRERIAFSAACSDLARCDIVFIAADVPTDVHGKSDLLPIISLVDKVCSQLRDDAAL